MKRAFASVLMLAAASCVTVPQSPDLDRFQTALPEFGLTEGPDGFYLTRTEGPFGQNHRSQIWRYPHDGGAPAPAAFSHPGASDSDLTWNAQTARACFVRDSDILCMPWNGSDGWGAPENPGSPINTDGYEASPHLAADGSLYFSSMRDGGTGQGDIYRAMPDTSQASGWRVEMLGPAINSEFGEWNVTLSPTGMIMVFEASGRATNRTASGDLYYSCLKHGAWEPAQPLAGLNTDNSDLDFRFTSERTGIFTSATIGGDGVLRHAGPEHFAECE